jgi:hypothetical protein
MTPGRTCPQEFSAIFEIAEKLGVCFLWEKVCILLWGEGLCFAFWD